MNLHDNTPDILLYMPEPEHIVETMSGLAKERKLVEDFIKSIEHDDVDKIIEKLNHSIVSIMHELSDEPRIQECYKNIQQRLSDEYFFIERTYTNLEKRFVLNAYVIARDLLVDNKLDDYLAKNKVRLTLNVMAKLLSYAVAKGDIE